VADQPGALAAAGTAAPTPAAAVVWAAQSAGLDAAEQGALGRWVEQFLGEQWGHEWAVAHAVAQGE